MLEQILRQASGDFCCRNPDAFGEEAEESSSSRPGQPALQGQGLKVVTGRDPRGKTIRLNSRPWSEACNDQRRKAAVADRDVHSTDYETDPEDASEEMRGPSATGWCELPLRCEADALSLSVMSEIAIFFRNRHFLFSTARF